jgi:hypothetical protein
MPPILFMKQILAILMLLSFGCGHQIYELNDKLFDDYKYGFWHHARTGGVVVYKNKIYTVHENKLVAQHLFNKEKVFEVNVALKKNSSYFANSVIVADEHAYVCGYYKQEALYPLCKINLTDNKIVNIHRRSMQPGMIAPLPEGRIAMAAPYRPNQLRYTFEMLKLTMAGDYDGRDKLTENYYKDVATYALTIFDDQLNVLDTLGSIDRTGHNLRYFERSYSRTPLFVSNDNKIYVCTNDKGYAIDVYDSDLVNKRQIAIHNPSFKKIADDITHEVWDEIKAKDGVYSSVYYLWSQGDLLLSSFFVAPKYFDPISPPYYYDITDKNGDIVSSWQSDHPMLVHGENNESFFYVEQEGGWFESNRHFIVGLTMQELLDGQGKTKALETIVKGYILDHDD